MEGRLVDGKDEPVVTSPDFASNLAMPRRHRELKWVSDYTEHFSRVSLWRTTRRRDYEARDRELHDDIEIAYRISVTITGVALADRPDLGVVSHHEGGYATTRVAGIVEQGPWMNPDGTPHPLLVE